jgi:hypothetical protein
MASTPRPARSRRRRSSSPCSAPPITPTPKRPRPRPCQTGSARMEDMRMIGRCFSCRSRISPSVAGCPWRGRSRLTRNTASSASVAAIPRHRLGSHLRAIGWAVERHVPNSIDGGSRSHSHAISFDARAARASTRTDPYIIKTCDTVVLGCSLASVTWTPPSACQLLGQAALPQD